MRLTVEQRDTITSAIHHGVSTQELAKKFGVSEHTIDDYRNVYESLKRNGMIRNPDDAWKDEAFPVLRGIAKELAGEYLLGCMYCAIENDSMVAKKRERLKELMERMALLRMIAARMGVKDPFPKGTMDEIRQLAMGKWEDIPEDESL